MRGRDVPLAIPPTEAKKLLVVVLRGPRTPLLPKTLILPLAATRTWVGPTSPVVSGGTELESPFGPWMPRKLVPTARGEAGGIRLKSGGTPSLSAAGSPAGQLATGRASGLGCLSRNPFLSAVWREIRAPLGSR